MNTQATADSPLNIVALGWGLSAALVILLLWFLLSAFAVLDESGKPRCYVGV